MSRRRPPKTSPPASTEVTLTPSDGRTRSPELLIASGLCVDYGSVRALEGVDFNLRSGEIHALMGENGAGKSTLIKCLTGVVSPANGQILLSGERVRPSSPHDAESLGIAAVFQEVGLIPHLSVAENICLGREPLRRFWPRLVDWSKVRSRAASALARLGLTRFDVRRDLGSCSVAIQQLVAIARALDVNARVLILDEPTSSLDRQECAALFQVLRDLRGQGLGIVFISHFLDQVEAIADRITVLRDGKLVGTLEAHALSRSKLVSLMVGREFDAAPNKKAVDNVSQRQPAFLTARGLSRKGALEHVDLDVAPGEAVGLAGLLGSGRTETARLLFGADAPTSGSIHIKQRPARFHSPRTAIAAGVAMTPEDRKAEGLLPSLSVLENVVLALQANRGMFARLSRAEQHRIANDAIVALGIKTPDAHTPISRLSGGNQQKALLARWFATDPSLLILDEPTRGIDIAAKADVLNAVERMREGGMAVLFISSELEEVVRTCTRVVVMRDRRSVAELQGGQVTEDAVLVAVAAQHG